MRSGRRRRGAAWDGRHLAEVDDDSAVVDEAVVHFKIAEARKDDWREERPGMHSRDAAWGTRKCDKTALPTDRQDGARAMGQNLGQCGPRPQEARVACEGGASARCLRTKGHFEGSLVCWTLYDVSCAAARSCMLYDVSCYPSRAASVFSNSTKP